MASRATWQRVLLALGAGALTLLCVAPLVALLVWMVAGPHASHLPQALTPVALGLGWLTVLALPVWVARHVWQRLARGGGPA